MIKLYRLWMNLFGPRDWSAKRDPSASEGFIMRRWNGSDMEYRRPTEREAGQVSLDWATK